MTQKYRLPRDVIAASTPPTIKPLPAEGPIHRLLEGLSRSGAGEDYFRILVEELVTILRVEYAFVAEVSSEDPATARTVALFADGGHAPEIEYEIGVTPCQELFFERYCCYPEGVRDCFPQDQLFVDWTVEGYAGARLVDRSGALLGWLGVMSRSPILDTSLVRSALCFVAERTSAELQRRRAEREREEAFEALEKSLASRASELERINELLRQEIERRSRIEQELVESKERYELAARGSNDGLWDWNLESGTLHVSDRCRGIVGWSDEAARSWEEWLGTVHPEDREQVEELMERHWNGERSAFEAEYRVGGFATDRWALCRGAVLRNERGEITRFAGSLTDITSRKRYEQRLVFEATHDHLTGLANRALFLDRVEHAIAINAREHVYDFAVLFIDLDRFKVVNDSLGHQSGDQLLCEVAQRIESSLRPGDLVARLGGDEFAVLIENISGPRAATQVADRIFHELTAPVLVSGQEIYPGASIGIAISTTGYRSAVEMIRDADTAMYRAKDHGRGCYEIFDDRMHLEAVERLRIESDIRGAIDNEQLRLFYQPIVSTDSARLSGFEALIRWEHPGRGIVMPSEFIPIIEETGLITSVGAWVARNTCRQLRNWKDLLSHPITLSVNLSPRELRDPGLVERMRSFLCDHELDGGAIRLEITESAVMENAESAVEIFHRLRAMGLHLCIDDFGTGYSSLAYLARFPIDLLKIDRSFVSHMEDDPQSEEMVRMIVALAHNLELEVIAEGVETITQLKTLMALHCDYVQGFLLSPPLSEGDATRFLERKEGRSDPVFSILEAARRI